MTSIENHWDFVRTPLGHLVLVSENNKIKEAFLSSTGDASTIAARLRKTYGPGITRKKLSKAAAAVQTYFQGDDSALRAIPIAPEGTKFQQQVWAELRRIPQGKTRSYGEVAKKLRRPNAARAVGGACNKNPCLLFVPCHRVIGSNGKLVGFAGGVAKKQTLLRCEQQTRGV